MDAWEDKGKGWLELSRGGWKVAVTRREVVEQLDALYVVEVWLVARETRSR